MADSELDILVRTIADTHGSEAVSASLKKLNSETAKSTIEAGKATKGYSDMAQGLKLLGREFPILGAIGRAITNPLVAGFALLAVAFRALSSQIKETIALLEPSEWRGRADAILAGKRAFEDSAIASRAYWQELNRAVTETQRISEASDDLVGTIHAEAAAVNEVIEARRQLALAGVEDPARRAAIESTFRQESETGRQVEEQRVANALIAERVRLNERLAQLSQQLPALQQRSAEAVQKIATVEAERAIHTENVAKANAQIAKFDAEMEKREKFGMRSSIFDKLTDADVRAARGSEVSSRDEANAMLTNLSRRRMSDTVAGRSVIAESSAAEAELRAGASRRDQIDRQIDQNRRVTSLRQRTGGQVGALDSAAGLGVGLIAAAEGADAIRGGRRATREQSEAINQLTSILGLSRNNTQTILQVMSRFNDSQRELEAGLRRVESRTRSSNTRPVSP